MWFSQHVFTAVRKLVGQSTNVDEVIHVLKTIENICLRVPVYFIQSLSQGYRGPSLDPQLTQVKQDLNRETVILCEREFHGTLGDSDKYSFSSKILFLLMESIRRKDEKLTSMEILRFAKKVLLHVYRSQTGGDCYNALRVLLNQTTLVNILSTSVPSQKNPIRINVTDTVPNISDVRSDSCLHVEPK